MSGLYFKYGTMNSSKTANLLMAKHNYEEQGFDVILLKPDTDTRSIKVTSRVGLSSDCIGISSDAAVKEIIELECNNRHDTISNVVIMVDEAQFLTPVQVNDLYVLSFKNVVMCYGLLTDFRRELFPSSKSLIELADSIQEIKSICRCGKRAIANARFKNGKFTLAGEQVEIGAEDKYKALCKECYQKEFINLLASRNICEDQ